MRQVSVVPVLLLLAACGPDPSPPPQNKAQLVAAPQPPPPSPAVDPRKADVDAIQAAILDPNSPTFSTKSAQPNLAIVKAEVLLARARFSPGVIDGKDGTNFHHALAAYQATHNLETTGKLDTATWQALTPSGGLPVAKTYLVTSADVQGPFGPDVGEDFVKLAALDQGPGYTSPLEALAERFHMSQALLQGLNPNADFKTAGQAIVVVDAEPPPFQPGVVKSISVSKVDEEVTAFGADGQVLGVYPATVGSTERPSPSGTHKVTVVKPRPDYVYDPAKLHWGPRSAGKLVIKAGPNNPVGTTWIGLNAPGYGMHGTPEPEKIGKTASHGCVRMTNWDADALGAGTKAGILVSFVGGRDGKPYVASKASPDAADPPLRTTQSNEPVSDDD